MIHQNRGLGPRRVRSLVTIAYTIMMIGSTTIAISATMSNGKSIAPPSTSTSAKAGKIGNTAAKLVVPATATPKRESMMANRITIPMNITGNANMPRMTVTKMPIMRPHPVFCDLSTLTLGRLFSPNSAGAPICALTFSTIVRFTTCMFLAKSAFWNSSAIRASMSAMISWRSFIGNRNSMSCM